MESVSSFTYCNFVLFCIALKKPCKIKQNDKISDSFTHILRLLVSEFTLAENPANTVTSKLRYVCKNEEGILLGICPVQHSHHQTIEDQVMDSLLYYNTY